MKRFKYQIFIISLILHTSCGFKVSSLGSHSNSGNFIAGTIFPFSGLIAENKSSLSIISTASAALCADPVYAKLFAIENNGSINENNPIATQLIGADARYSFNVNTLGISVPSLNVQFLIKAEGCNGDTYKRPVTSFNNLQNVDAKSTVIAEVINANTLITKTLNQASRADIENLINSVSGTSTSAVLTSLTSEATNSTKFTEIFGASPAIIHDSSPEVKLITPASTINELAVNNFSIQAFHVDPTYSFAYSWKLDGVVKSTSASWNYIPSANESGIHTIVLYVGKNNGSGNIDLTKPYYTKSAAIIVNNNMLPNPPNLVLNPSTPTPRNTNSVLIDLSTGVSLANCSTFSHLAITDTPNIPGIMQFNINCLINGSQTENVLFSAGDGAKTLYLWAIDEEGNISTPKTISLVLDTAPPTVTFNLAATNLRGGTTQALFFSASDAGVGLNTVDLYFSTDNGTTYSFVSSLSNSATSFNWSVPSIDTNSAKLKLVATDLGSSSTTIYSSIFVIDSTAPSIPTIVRSSSLVSQSNFVSISTTCTADYYQILYTETATAPSLVNLNWETCNISKTFTASTGDGFKSIYAFTRDASGNISLSSNITMTLDTTIPTLSVTSFNDGAYFQGGSTHNITWAASDGNFGATPISIAYSSDGTNYISLANNLANSGTYSWTLPLIDSTTVTIKITAIDTAANVKTITSNAFSMDSTIPTISNFTLANATASVALPSVSVQVNAADNGSGLFQMRLSENSNYSNDNWQSYSTTSGAYNLSMISGNKVVYLWLKDQVGNISNSSSVNISLDIGNPPVISITAPTSFGGPYAPGDIIHVEWSCSSVNGLNTNPARIAYTTDDGASFITATTWLPNNLTSTSGSYDWTLPGGITVFRLLVECKSAAGVVSSSYSSPLNTNGWSVFAGDPASMSENVSASLALMSKGSAGYQTMAVDKLGNIFFAKNSLMMKVDSQTGLVTRFAGDPNGGGTCSMQAGSDPLNSSFNKIGNSFTIFGMNLARNSMIVGGCGKIWLLNTATRALSILNNSSAYNGSPHYFSKTGFLFYANNGYVYKLNLNSLDQSPLAIMGNGTCSPVIASAGTEALSSAVPGINAGGCSGETYLYTNSDDTKLWVGCWNGVSGCQNAASSTWDAGQNKFIITSNNVGWGMSWDYAHCSTSYVSNRVWCSSRYSTGMRSYFNTQTETWTQVALGKTVFIRYAASPNGMVSLSSDNFLNSYIENNDNSISIGQIGGSDIESYGNGNDFKKLAFSAVEDITYSSGLNSLFIDTSVKIRRMNLNTTLASTLAYSGYLIRLTINSAGTHISTIFSCGGNMYLNTLFDGTLFTGAGFTIMNRNVCGQSTFDAAYPVASGTSVNSKINWTLDNNRRPLNHSNGKMYFSTADASGNNVILYSSNGFILNVVAGITGPSGFSAGDTGNLANTALLKNVRTILEVPAGKPNAGDLLIVDNNRLRLITVATESASPKIYDLVSFNMATGYGSNSSDNFTDVTYDFNSELLNGSSLPILGTGAMYYVTSTNIVRKFIVSSVAGDTPTLATDTPYSFTGTTLSGNIRLALTPSGLLVTQPNKNRILRVDP